MPEAIPRIISVDDHVVEPPTLWTDRLPAKYLDRAPRVERDRAVFHFEGGVFSYERGVEDGEWCDWWVYDDLVYPFPKLSAAIGFADLDVTPTTFDDIRPGCWIQSERLADMTANHVDASVCFPNTLPRFCGQAFYERADKDLALLCVQAYNDWMLDEWSAGEGKGRLLPLVIVPLWDPALCADEVRRCAAKGALGVAFSENPHPLGLPSVHDPSRFWDPFFAACEETGTVVCMHIGSSSKMPATSPDAPFIVSSTLTFSNAMGSMLDYIFSGTLVRFPELVLAYSEGQVGWMPYVLERADKLWAERSANAFGSSLPDKPSSYLHHRIYGCVFDDEVGLRNRDLIGIDQICFETDYPHADSTFPHSKKVATDIIVQAGLSDEEAWKFLRGNAIRCFRLDEHYGISALTSPMETGGDIKLGSALFTMVEPHKGHEVAYNRWYERDHFYAGCMVGPWLFAGRRWVATREEKSLRTGAKPHLFGDGSPGTYLAVYWVLDGKHEEHFDWGTRQVHWLHDNDRMFAERDHIHTLLYRFGWAVGRDDDGVPPELALDHPYSALVSQFVERADGVDWRDLESWFAERRGDTPAIGQTMLFRPIPLPEGAPVTQPGMDNLRQRSLVLRFADAEPAHAAGQATDQSAAFEDAGLGTVLWTSAFRPTIPGTDTYTDQLW